MSKQQLLFFKVLSAKNNKYIVSFLLFYTFLKVYLLYQQILQAEWLKTIDGVSSLCFSGTINCSKFLFLKLKKNYIFLLKLTWKIVFQRNMN